MGYPAYVKTVTLAAGDTYEPLTAIPTDMPRAQVSCPVTNAGSITFKDGYGNESEWEPGEFHELFKIDLATLQVKGALADKVTIVGGGV